MKELLTTLDIIEAKGVIDRHDRDRLMRAFTRAWVAFADVLGEDFYNSPSPVNVASAQMSEIRARVEKAYALPLASYRFQVAVRQAWKKDCESAKRLLRKLFA